jgi:CheY-like chemotaxis protein
MPKKLIDSVEPNVVVLDLLMPGLDGFEAARRIRDRDPHRRTRLIALTGLQAEDTLEHAAKAGFDEFLKKAVSGQTILAALNRPLSKTRAHESLES